MREHLQIYIISNFICNYKIIDVYTYIYIYIYIIFTNNLRVINSHTHIHNVLFVDCDGQSEKLGRLVANH